MVTGSEGSKDTAAAEVSTPDDGSPCFPRGKTLLTTNVIERLHEEFRRRVKTQGSLPSETPRSVLLFSLVASGQIKLRRIDGWKKIAAVLSQHTTVAA
jgi:transposase-like protein